MKLKKKSLHETILSASEGVGLAREKEVLTKKSSAVLVGVLV